MIMNEGTAQLAPEKRRLHLPLYVRILIGVALGTAVGVVWKSKAAPLGEIGMLVIILLKTLATPLILFAVLDAFMRTRIPAKQGAKLLAISFVNATVAIIIGLSVANLLRGGEQWQGHIEPMKREIERSSASGSRKDL